MRPSLPTGRRGQLLALGITLAMTGLLWLGAVAPLLGWYAARGEALAARRQVAAHMQMIAATLPALRQAASRPAASAPSLLAGDSDALAAAALQALVGRLAAASDITPTSLETLPAAPRGRYRRVGIRLSLTAPWPQLVGLLTAIARSHPRMLLDDLELRGLPVRNHGDAPPVDASFAVYAFRGAGA